MFLKSVTTHLTQLILFYFIYPYEVPIVAVVRDSPEAYYLVLSLTVFVLSMAILIFIFWPKISIQRSFAKMSEEEQKKAIKECIKNCMNSGRDSNENKSGGISSGSVENVQDNHHRSQPPLSGVTTAAMTTSDFTTSGAQQHQT